MIVQERCRRAQRATWRAGCSARPQLHRFAHEPTQARAILAIALEPFVDQLLDILSQLPTELHPILLAETALALRLTDGLATQPTDPPSGNGRR